MVSASTWKLGAHLLLSLLSTTSSHSSSLATDILPVSWQWGLLSPCSNFSLSSHSERINKIQSTSWVACFNSNSYCLGMKPSFLAGGSGEALLQLNSVWWERIVWCLLSWWTLWGKPWCSRHSLRLERWSFRSLEQFLLPLGIFWNRQVFLMSKMWKHKRKCKVKTSSHLFVCSTVWIEWTFNWKILWKEFIGRKLINNWNFNRLGWQIENCSRKLRKMCYIKINHETKMNKEGSENLKLFKKSEKIIETMVCIFS